MSTRRILVATTLFNPDVLFLLAALLDARDLCQVSLSCKTLGGKEATGCGLSLVEGAAKRLHECADSWEISCLPKRDGEGWIELYHHLLMLRSTLTFNQLVGASIIYGANQSTVRSTGSFSDVTFDEYSSALCSNHVMRSGRHFAVITELLSDGPVSLLTALGRPAGPGEDRMIGLIRPVKVNKSDFEDGELDGFVPGMKKFWGYLRAQRTERWGDSNVNECVVDASGMFSWLDWETRSLCTFIEGFEEGAPKGLLLDLDEGTLSIYQNSQRLAVLKDGLSGEYCWLAIVKWGASVSIRRGLVPKD